MRTFSAESCPLIFFFFFFFAKFSLLPFFPRRCNLVPGRYRLFYVSGVLCLVSTTSCKFTIVISPEISIKEIGDSHTITCHFHDINLEIGRLEVLWQRWIYARPFTLFRADNFTFRGAEDAENNGVVHNLPSYLDGSPMTGSTAAFPEFKRKHSLTFSDLQYTDATNYSCRAIVYRDSGREVLNSSQAMIVIEGKLLVAFYLFGKNVTGKLL